MKKWVYKQPDKILASELAKECGISKFTALLLVSKGITDPFEIDEFLSDEAVLQDPFCFADMKKGVEIIKDAILEGEKIAVFGDYDCDGITSTVLMTSVLKGLGANVIYKIPNRSDGYGISEKAVTELKDDGVSLIITVDNGITAFEAIELANKSGMRVVVTDHHLPGEKLPNADAVIDPKRTDCPSEFKDYAGVGVALMLCCALKECVPEDILEEYGDLVAIGTIADVMPILKDNRSIVKVSLPLIKNSDRVGILSLIECSGIKTDNFNSSSVSFGLAPRINASGRVLTPETAVRLLISEDKSEADLLARELCEANTHRQQIEKEILAKISELISKDNSIINAPVIAVAGEGWHEGVIGIVASRLCEAFSRPAIVFSLSGDFAHGSARSVGDASIYDIIADNPEFVYKFGGHSSAAGITVKRENLKKALINIENSANKLYPKMPFDCLEITCKLNPEKTDLNCVYAQRLLQPFGEKNEQPIYAFCNMIIADIIPLSAGKHLKLKAYREGENSTVEVLKFFTQPDEFPFKIGDKVDIALTLDISFFNNKESLSFIAKDILPSNTNIDSVLDGLRNYQNFKYFGEKSDIKLCRDDIVGVYKKIRSLKKLTLNEASAVYILGQADFFKLRVILDILAELDFIKYEYKGTYEIEYIENATHKDLSQSEIFNYFS